KGKGKGKGKGKRKRKRVTAPLGKAKASLSLSLSLQSRSIFSSQSPHSSLSLRLLDNLQGHRQQINDLMGYIIVISLPVILLFLIIAIGCYLFGKNRGRSEATTTQYYGPPAPPYGVQPQATPINNK
ncbi:hypothetical protein Ccrd_004005, partial [Cynara cardunculus var. scolymus]